MEAILFASPEYLAGRRVEGWLEAPSPAAMPALVVLGMHRSGTSSVAGALVRLGGAAPTHLMPDAPDNPVGFYESTAIMALNEAVLEAAGTRWDDWRAFRRNPIAADVVRALRERAARVLHWEFAGARLPVLKDPRMCRLVSFWRPVLRDAGWSPRVVMPIRSPFEVARSLEKRDGLHPTLGGLLWLRYVLDAEAATRGVPRALVDWPAFLADSPGVLDGVAQRLGIAWPSAAAGRDAVKAFVSPSLRHFTSGADEARCDGAIGAFARDVHRCLLTLADEPGDRVTLSRLDAMRLGFDTACDVFSPAMRHSETRALAAETHGRSREARIAALEAERAAARDALVRANAAIAALSERSAAHGRLNAVRQRGDRRALRASAFFDGRHYLAMNPDVRDAGRDAADHYLTAGAREGRDPGPHFSSRAYLARNPDVAEAGMNPLLHYERHGRAEGRPAIG